MSMHFIKSKKEQDGRWDGKPYPRTAMTLNKYYRLKVGAGDSLYPLFKTEGFGGLWTGWSVADIHATNPKSKGDAKFIKEASEQGGYILVWDRLDQKVAVWRINGRIRKFTARDKVLVKEHFEKDEKKWNAVKKQNKESEDKFVDWVASGTIIPAEKVLEICRSSLPAFIDSLSVYRYFNRGTFRPLHVINKEHDLAVPISKGVHETFYAALVRHFFEWIMSRSEKAFSSYLEIQTKFYSCQG